MPAWLITVLSMIGTSVLTLTVSYVFNKFIGFPKERKKEEAKTKLKNEQLVMENQARDQKIAILETAIGTLPNIRAQSLEIQQQLQSADKDILAICNDIKDSVEQSRENLNKRLDRLEAREKNALRQKILNEYKIFADEAKNPSKAWSEMEQHSFFKLVGDYEDLHGNDYVHTVVLPEMNKLTIIPMSDLAALDAVYKSRKF